MSKVYIIYTDFGYDGICEDSHVVMVIKNGVVQEDICHTKKP